MSEFSITDHPHRRLNILTGEWVLVSPHRAKRPWQGQVEKIAGEARPEHDPSCYLCPRNSRANGVVNPQYSSTYVFQNDFSALLPDAPEGEVNKQNLLVAQSERGLCRVICFSPRHDLSLAQMTVEQIRPVIDLWVEQYQELSAISDINYILIFENKGPVMGCSNPHPHGQIWSNERIPGEPAREDMRQQEYADAHGRCMLCDYVAHEIADGTRVVCKNEHYVAVVPFWAYWPFETLVLPRRHMGAMPSMTDTERDALADIMQRLTVRYDNLFETSFPYSMGWHQAPTDGASYDAWHFHAHFFPPLLRSATVKKFAVGYEMLASPQRDITPEQAAARLAALPEIHYLKVDEEQG